VTLIYGPGIPMLYFVAAAGFTLRYWVELYCDLRIYRRPILYGRELVGTSFADVLSLMMVLHAFISTVVVAVAGGDNPVDTSVSVTMALKRPHALPMIICFTAAFICFVFKALAHTPLRQEMLKWRCSLRCLDDQSGVLNEELKTFSNAYREGLLGNEDDDYYMDELEALRDKQALFLKELEAQRASFDQNAATRALHTRLRVAIGAVSQNSSRDLADHLSGGRVAPLP
jgi:hypothetical protein